MGDQTEVNPTEEQDGGLSPDQDSVAPAPASVDDGSAVPTNDDEKTPEELAREKTDKLKESIAVQIETIGTLRQRLTVTVPRQIVEERLDEQFQELQRERDVRGFRRGRAPRRLVEKAFGSEVNDLVKDQVVGEAYLAAVEKEAIDVLGDPDLDFEKIKLPPEGDLQFSCEVEVKPEFELPELTGIPIRRPVIKITDEDVDRQMGRLRMRLGHYDPVEGGAVQADDLVVADVKLTVDGTVIEESNVQFAARPSRIEGIVVEKLGEVLVGARSGDERTLEVTVPDDHEKPEYRGKTATFHIKVHDIKRLVLPAMDDAFARMAGFDDLAEMRTMLRAEVESRLDQEIRRGMREQVRRYLLDHTQLEIPPALGSRQTERVVARQMIELQRQGVPEVEIEKHLDELRTTARAQAALEVKAFFVLEKVADRFGITVSEDELNGQVAQIARAMNRRFDRVRDELMNRGTLQALYIGIREDKCLDRLLEDARITDVTPEQADRDAVQEQAETAETDTGQPADAT